MRKEELDKLKQLDRIEYLLREGEIKRNFPQFHLHLYIGFFIILMILIAIMGMLVKLNYGEEAFINFMSNMLIIPKGFGFLIPFLVGFYFISLFIWILRRIKLNKEFFKVEVKSKR